MKRDIGTRKAALFYASQYGFKVFPVVPGEKRPAIGEWQKEATTDPERIEAWWNENPLYNVGVVTGETSGIDVVDVDAHHGGTVVLDDLEVEFGKLPATPTVVTPHKGTHLYFRHLPGVQLRNNNSGAIGTGIDFKTTGGYVLLPPSRLLEGEKIVDVYGWDARPVIPGEENGVEFAPLPAWIAERLIAAQGGGAARKGKAAEEAPETIREGGRNDYLTRVAGALRRKGLQAEEILGALLEMNRRRCVPPLPEGEVRVIANSIGKRSANDPIPAGPPREAAPAAAPETVAEEELTRCTDMGNAEMFARLHRGRARYVEKWGKWIAWDGQSWARDDADGRVMAMAKEAVRALYEEAAGLGDDDERKRRIKHALKSESAGALKALLMLAQSEEGIPIDADALDAGLDLLTCKNGTVNLRTGEIRGHRAEDYCTRSASVEYDPAVHPERWLKFLEKIFLGNEELIRFMQKAIGYSLTGHSDERCMFILYGAGRNGKSTLQDIVSRVVGEYAVRTPVETVLVQRENGIPNDVAALMGARFVYTSESDEGRRLSEARIKDLAGGSEKISARFMRGEWFSFRPTFKLWFSTNHKPIIRGTDNAIWDRIRLVPFQYRFTDDEVRPAREVVDPIVQEEGAGILAWMVEGARRWYEEGLKPPKEVRDATNEYRAEQDALGGFILECCVVRSYEAAYSKELYQAYEKYCAETGEKPISQKAFSIRLMERGFQKTRTKAGSVWNGIRVRRDSDGCYESDSDSSSRYSTPQGSPRNPSQPYTGSGDGCVGLVGEKLDSAENGIEGPQNPSQSNTHNNDSVNKGVGCRVGVGFSYISEANKNSRVINTKIRHHPSPVTNHENGNITAEKAATYAAHVAGCLFCSNEDGEVELCDEGKALFQAYLQAKEGTIEEVKR